MANTKYKAKASSSEKSSPKSTVTHLDPKRIKESAELRWKKKLAEFYLSLSESELVLAKKLACIIADMPDESTELCEVFLLQKES